MLLLRQVLLLLILLLLATVTEWAPHWSMSLVPADVASPHVSEISVLQVQNAVPCPVVWRGYEREEKEGEREVDNLSTCGCVIQLYLWENTRFIEIREFGWGFLMLTS